MNMKRCTGSWYKQVTSEGLLLLETEVEHKKRELENRKFDVENSESKTKSKTFKKKMRL